VLRLLAGNVLFGAGLFIHAFLFNYYLRELNLAATAMGHQVAAMTLGGLAGLLPAGMLIDRRGARAVMLAGVGVTVLGLVLTALFRTAGSIYAAAFIVGLGAASCRVSWGPAIMRLAGETSRSRAFTWNAAILVGSGSVWVLLSGVLADWSRAMGTVAGLTGTQLVLLGGALLTAASALCYAPLRALDDVSRAPAPAVPALAPPPGLRLPIAAVAAWMLPAALVLPFFNVYFTDRFALSVASVGTLFAVAHAGTAVLLAGAAELARRRGAYRMFVLWVALMAPALLALAYTASLPLAIALFFAQGFIAPATNPLIDHLLLERTTPERHGVVSSWRNAAAEGAGAAGASVGGAVLVATSYPTLFMAAAVIAAATSALVAYSLRRRETRRAVTLAADPA
jgi:MFS family permease